MKRKEARWRGACEVQEEESLVDFDHLDASDLKIMVSRTRARKPDLDDYDGEPRLEYRGYTTRHHQ